MALRVNAPSLQRPYVPPVPAPSAAAVPVAAAPIGVPTNPADAAPVKLPDAPLKGLEIVEAIMHPIRTIKGFWSWGKGLRKFDALGGVTSDNALAAQAALKESRRGLDMMGLGRFIPFLANSVDKRAAAAITQLRPSIEERLGVRTTHDVNVMWPVGGRNWQALDELVMFDKVLKDYPDATIQKVLNGVAEINVQRLSAWDYFNPIQKKGATLFIQRPVEWLPGQPSMEESLRRYLDKASLVTANV